VWLGYLETRKVGKIIVFVLLLLACFFTHALPFAFGCLCCFTLAVSFALAGDVPLSARKKALLLGKNLLVLALCCLPFVLLFFSFTGSEGGLGTIGIGLAHYRLWDLLKNFYMICYSGSEMVLAEILAWVYVVLFAIAMFMRLRKGMVILKYDGFILTCAIAGWIYLFFPDILLGGAAFSVRAHFILFLLASCCIAWLLPSDKLRSIVGIVFFACFIALSIIRISVQLPAARAVADIRLCSPYIKPHTIVLPLCFSPNGKDENGKVIANRAWMFTHAAQYIGLNKPLIFLDNYEANTGYFPLVWKKELNPYHYLGKEEGIEGVPPYAELASYKQTSGVTVDYIIMWCYDSSFLQNEHFSKFYTEINAGYNKIYTSPAGRTILFEKK
jgi:hypothetical protein